MVTCCSFVDVEENNIVQCCCSTANLLDEHISLDPGHRHSVQYFKQYEFDEAHLPYPDVYGLFLYVSLIKYFCPYVKLYVFIIILIK